MAEDFIDLTPVTGITINTIGPPGEREFYFQAHAKDQSATLLLEKFQAQALALHISKFLAEIAEKHPSLHHNYSSLTEELMLLKPPIVPLFRAAEIQLGYNLEDDQIVIALYELLAEDDTTDIRVVRIYCTREQAYSLAAWTTEVVSRGRPICNQCGAPIPTEGHFCVKKNGGHENE